jgi:predicted transcriptional regulator
MGDRTGWTVAEVADKLRITPEAVRKRISRGTLEADKGRDNTWTVYLDENTPDRTEHRTEGETKELEETGHFWELINDQKQEIERLRQELERERLRVDLLIERIPPQLPAPEEERENKTGRKSWWKRITRR